MQRFLDGDKSLYGARSFFLASKPSSLAESSGGRNYSSVTWPKGRTQKKDLLPDFLPCIALFSVLSL